MAKKSIIIFAFMAAIVLSFCSCTLETSDNGDLDGAWHLLRINGEPLTEHPDLYWNVQGKMLELRDKSTKHDAYILRFSRTGSQLQLSEPYLYDREDGDKPLEDMSGLIIYGIDDVTEPFTIEKLDGSRMTLKSSTKKLEFRQF